MYAAFRQMEPSLNTGIDYSKEYSAARGNGALWSGHSSLYLDQFSTVGQLLELSVDTGSQVPVVFPDACALLRHAHGKYDVHTVGRTDRAYRLMGHEGSLYWGVDQLWVRAGSSRYREHMRALWGKELHDGGTHQEAVTVWENCIKGVQQGTLRQRLGSGARKQLVDALTVRRDRHGQQMVANVDDRSLMRDFDCTINADHVYNRAVLPDDYYVWIFPEPADANQGFGRQVESHRAATKIHGVQHLTPELVFKMLSGASPATAAAVDTTLEHVLARLGGSGKLADWHESISVFADGLKHRLA